MELSLFNNDLPIVLTKPGLLHAGSPARVTVGTGASVGDKSAPDAIVKKDQIPDQGDHAGQLEIEQQGGTSWPDGVTVRYRKGKKGKYSNPVPVHFVGTNNKRWLRLDIPADANGDIEFQVYDKNGKVLADIKAPVPTRVALDPNGNTAGPASVPDPDQSRSKFSRTVDKITDGVHAVGNLVNSFANVADAGRQVAYAINGPSYDYGNNYGYGYNYGAPYGVGGGYGIGLIGPQNDHDAELREQSRRITLLLYQLMHAIQMGNLDAIPTALTMISLRGKRTLLQAAGRAVRAMESFEKQQQMMNEKMASLSAEGNPNYASSLQSLSNQMNMYSSNRQAIVNFLRDVKSMSDELENMEKSWLDVDLRQGRQQMSWNA